MASGVLPLGHRGQPGRTMTSALSSRPTRRMGPGPASLCSSAAWNPKASARAASGRDPHVFSPVGVYPSYRICRWAGRRQWLCVQRIRGWSSAPGAAPRGDSGQRESRRQPLVHSEARRRLGRPPTSEPRRCAHRAALGCGPSCRPPPRRRRHDLLRSLFDLDTRRELLSSPASTSSTAALRALADARYCRGELNR